MKYTIKQYAEALHDALEEARDDDARKSMIRRFMMALRRNRASMHLERIIAAFEKYYLSKRNVRKIEIRTASELKEEDRKTIADLTGKNAIIDVIIQPDLLAGMTITIDDELMIDASGKRRLERLFTK